MDQGRARFRDYVGAGGLAGSVICFAKKDARPKTFDRTHFHLRGIARHDDVRRNSAKLGRARKRSSVVPGRMCRDAAFRDGFIERENGVCRATRFERTDLLQILAFEK